MMRATKWGLSVAACAVLFSLPARADFILNGGFESPIAPANGFTRLDAGSGALAPWTITSGSVDVVSNGFWPAFEGSQSLDLNGLESGTIEQIFGTIAGQSYRLNFAYANNSDGDVPLTASALVSVLGSGGSSLLSQSITHSNSTRANMNYTLFSGSFTANSASTTLRFASTTAGARGIVLDAVSVNAIPEPSAFALLGLGTLSLLGYRGRKTLARGLVR